MLVNTTLSFYFIRFYRLVIIFIGQQYIKIENEKINTKVSNTKKLIALLKEYKTALISEVVTGKIKVNQQNNFY